jgi:CubicO group peptidase (beta-lactamase class C family)
MEERNVMKRRIFLLTGLFQACVVLLILAGTSATAVPSVVELPDTLTGQHAAAWLEAFNSGDAASMRSMYEAHLSTEALAKRSIDDRLSRYQEMHERIGRLMPVRVVEATDDFLRVVAKSGSEGAPYFQLDFEFEPKAPSGISRIRLQSVRSPADADRRPPPLTAEDLPAQFDAYLSSKTKSDEFSGTVLVAKRGTPVFRRAYGLAERRFDVPNQVDTRFDMGSIGKLITHLAIAQLAEAGKLELDDRLDRWLPDWPKEPAAKITIEHLVMHRSGVPDFLNEPYLNARFFKTDRSQLRHNRDFLVLFRDEPLLFEPGTSERYSNSGFVLLGEVIAKASGEDYYDYVRKHILDPAGMKHTDYIERDAVTSNVARGYYPDADAEGGLRENTILLWPRGFAAGSAYTTVDDLLRFEQALRGAKLASPAWSRWVLGGPKPGASSADQPIPDGYALMGGAQGISALLLRTDEWSLIVLSNLDRRIISKVEDRLMDWLGNVTG